MNDSTALVVTSEEVRALLAQLDGLDLFPAGQENLEAGDTGMPPRLRISQRNRPIQIGDSEVPAGRIVNVLTGEAYDHLEIVVVVFLPRTRVLWPDAFSADNSPVCLSDNGKTPLRNGGARGATNPRRGPCETCKESEFCDGVAPACKLQRNFLVYMPETKEPAILTLSSTALKAARHLTQLAKTTGLKRAVIMTTQDKDSDQGRWHVPAFTKGRKLDVPEILGLVEVRNELQNLVVKADLQQDENNEDAGGFGEGPIIESPPEPEWDDEIAF